MDEVKVTPKKKKEPVDVIEVDMPMRHTPKKSATAVAKPVKKTKDKEPEPNFINDGRLAKISGLGLILFSF